MLISWVKQKGISGDTTPLYETEIYHLRFWKLIAHHLISEYSVLVSALNYAVLQENSMHFIFLKSFIWFLAWVQDSWSLFLVITVHSSLSIRENLRNFSSLSSRTVGKMRSTTCQLIFGLLSLKLYLTVSTFDNRTQMLRHEVTENVTYK